MDLLNNKKTGQRASGILFHIPRCYWTKSQKKHSPSVLIKCGDCDKNIRIYYDDLNDIHRDDLYEIGGVLADKKWWNVLFKKIGLLDESK